MSISLLPVRLQLLTFPKESLPYVTHAILKNVLFKKQNKFFSYTENSMEISIIADVETIENDFPKNNSPTCPGLCICEDPFRALQIDNEYGLEMSGKRINDLSAPLAQAGISIFYLSTYQTDFIFVKEKRIPLVVSVLKKSFQFIDLDLLNIEFPMYLNNNDEQFLPPENVSSWLSYDYDGNEEIENQKLSESQKGSDTTVRIPGEETGDETERDEEADQIGALNIPDDYRRRNYSNETMGWSYSPTYDFSTLSLSSKLPRQEDILVEVRRQCKKSLSDKNLRLIGLNREYMEGWALVMMKIMFYPEFLKTEEEIENESNSSRFFSYTSTDEGISLIVEEQILELFEEHMINMSLTPRPLRCIQIDLTTFGVGTLRLDRCGIVYSMSDPLTKSGINLLYLSTFKTANVLVNESMINQTLEVLDIYDDEKDSKVKKEEEDNMNSRDTIKELVTKIKDYNDGPKINPYRDSNYLRSVTSRGSENSYLVMNRNKALNYPDYKDADSLSQQQRSSSAIINQINGYDGVSLQYSPEPIKYSNNTSPNGSHILSNRDSFNSSPTDSINGSQVNGKNRNSLTHIGLPNIYGQSHYSVSISPTTVTAEPSSTTMNSVTVKPSTTVSSQHYITNRSYYDYTFDNKIQAYTNTTTVNGNNYRKDMDEAHRSISYFHHYHPLNPTTRISSDVYTSSGFTFK